MSIGVKTLCLRILTIRGYNIISVCYIMNKVRKKVFVIPFYNDKVMLVKDRKTKEWGFVSGGVKKNESYFQAATRELFEETSGLMPYIPKGEQPPIWKTDYRPDELLIENKKKGEKVSSHYKIFWVPINEPFAKHLEKEFKPNDEVTQIKVDNYWSFKKRWIVCDMYMKTLTR